VWTAPLFQRQLEVDPTIDTDRLTARLPPHVVLLHNDEVNDMAHVVDSLIAAVPPLSRERATEIMLDAHNHGRARVIVCPLEQAELYRDRLLSRRLTATIEAA